MVDRDLSRAGYDRPRPPSRNDATTQLAADLRMACMRLTRRVRVEATDGVPLAEFSVLSWVYAGELSVTELASAEGVSRPTMSETVNAVVRKGLARRREDQRDRRRMLVSLTKDGQELFERIAEARDTWMVDRLKQISSRDHRVLARAAAILDRISGPDGS